MEEEWEGVESVAWMRKRQELGAETGSDWPVRGSVFKTRTKLHKITKLPLQKYTLKSQQTLKAFTVGLSYTCLLYVLALVIHPNHV